MNNSGVLLNIKEQFWTHITQNVITKGKRYSFLKLYLVKDPKDTQRQPQDSPYTSLTCYLRLP